MNQQYFIFSGRNPALGRKLYKYLLDLAEFESCHILDLPELRKELSASKNSVVICAHENDLQSVKWLSAELACSFGFQPRIFAVSLNMGNDASWSSEKIRQLSKDLTGEN